LYLVTSGVVHNDFKNAFNKIKIVGLGFVVVARTVSASRNVRMMHFKVGI
jgi:hypothetical protein